MAASRGPLWSLGELRQVRPPRRPTFDELAVWCGELEADRDALRLALASVLERLAELEDAAEANGELGRVLAEYELERRARLSRGAL